MTVLDSPDWSTSTPMDRALLAAAAANTLLHVKAASEYPDVKFIFIDGYPLSDANGNTLTNVVGVAFHEEQCGTSR